MQLICATNRVQPSKRPLKDKPTGEIGNTLKKISKSRDISLVEVLYSKWSMSPNPGKKGEQVKHSASGRAAVCLHNIPTPSTRPHLPYRTTVLKPLLHHSPAISWPVSQATSCNVTQQSQQVLPKQQHLQNAKCPCPLVNLQVWPHLTYKEQILHRLCQSPSSHHSLEVPNLSLLQPHDWLTDYHTETDFWPVNRQQSFWEWTMKCCSTREHKHLSECTRRTHLYIPWVCLLVRVRHQPFHCQPNLLSWWCLLCCFPTPLPQHLQSVDMESTRG